MKVLIPSNIARIVFGLCIGVFGITHFTATSDMLAMIGVAAFKSQIGVYISGAALILAAVAFIIHRNVRLAGYLLALLLVVIIGVVHVPVLSTDDMAMGLILRNLGLAMGAVYIANTGQ